MFFFFVETQEILEDEATNFQRNIHVLTPMSIFKNKALKIVYFYSFIISTRSLISSTVACVLNKYEEHFIFGKYSF